MNYGRYEIISELGRGAMGVVYQAHDPQIDRLVALKVLRDDRVGSEDYVQRFLKEAVAVGRLSHPAIVTVHDIGRDHGTIYIAMEYLEGTPLDELMAERNFSLREVIDIGIQAAAALDYAHGKGIVHRDIKPSNIIYTPDKRIKITDFGIAHIEDPKGHRQTMPGEMLGTPLYMSPEQIAGQGVDGRSDIFSLCVILYELTTGKRPFSGSNITAIFRSIAEGRPPEPREVNPAIPRPLSELIMRGLEKFADRRPASGEVLGRDLERISLSPEGEAAEELGTVRITPATSPASGGKGATIRLTGHENGVPPIEERETVHDSTWTPTLHDSLPGNGERSSRMDKISYPAMAGLLLMTVVFVSSGIYFFLERRGEEVVIKPLAAPMVTVPEETSTKKEESPEDTVRSLVTLPSADPQNPRVEVPVAKEEVVLALLQINSTPMGADIYVDGDFKGYTPAELNLQAAKHEVRLQLKDYLNWQAQLDLREGGVTPLTITLLPQ